MDDGTLISVLTIKEVTFGDVNFVAMLSSCQNVRLRRISQAQSGSTASRYDPDHSALLVELDSSVSTGVSERRQRREGKDVGSGSMRNIRFEYVRGPRLL